MIEFSATSIIFFRIVNFAIVVALFRYLFNAYARRSLIKQMSQQAEVTVQLQQSAEKLKTERSNLAEQIKRDQAECTRLKDKVLAWNRVVTKHNHARMEEKEQRIAQLHTSMNRQIEGIETRQLLEQATPQILHRLEQQLRLNFQDAARVQTYTKDVIKHLENQNG